MNNEDKIKEMGKTCRKLFDAGGSLHLGEAHLFLNSLRSGNFRQCDRLIETLKGRVLKK